MLKFNLFISFLFCIYLLGKVLDYCTFHECVSFSKWDSQRMLEFKCPSGTFTLMKYLVIDDFVKPFTFSTLVEEGPFDGQLEMVIKVHLLKN